MFEVFQRLGLHSHDQVDAELVLDHEQRSKGRLRASTSEGMEVRVFIERGKPLQVGEYLRTHCGKTLRVCGAQEPGHYSQLRRLAKIFKSLLSLGKPTRENASGRALVKNYSRPCFRRITGSVGT